MGPQIRLFQNACGQGRKRLVISLRGTKSNRDAIGARVEVDGQVKWVVAGSAYLSQHTKRLHFGLGDKARAEKVRVTWPSGHVQDLPPLDAGFLYQITEESAHPPVAQALKPAASRLVSTQDFAVDNRARPFTTWLWEPVPLPEQRKGPALLVLHAGESAPQYSIPTQALDLRTAPADLVAAYAIFRRYLFDYRVDLATPLWLLIDTAGRVRKIYAESPDAPTLQADLRTVDGAVPDRRALPFEGVYHGQPARDYFKIGGALWMAGYGEQALPYLEEASRRSPGNAKTLLAIGRIHLQANRLGPAREAIEQVTRLDPDSPEAWNDLGGVDAAAGNHRDALRMYEKALALGPDLPYALENAARMQEKLGNTAEAERLYRRALAADSRSGGAANGLGLLLAQAGHTEEARHLFEQAISVRRDDTSAINNLAVLYANIGQTNDAIAAFQYGIKVAPDDDTLYLNLARTWVRLGEREKARDVMRALLARKPGLPLAQKALKELEEP
jgi:Flp pilus assembly protein TadD